MSVEPNAAPDELDSPFYKEHEALCRQWEHYITEKEGKIIGNYNAWSFRLKCKVKGAKIWVIDITKTTFHDGHLWWTSKRQGLTEIVDYQTLLSTDCPSFKIKRSTLIGKGKNHEDAIVIFNLVKPAIDNGSLEKVIFKNKKLSIILSHQNNWFEFTDRLLAFDSL